MQYLQAKSAFNKIEALDNLPYAIDRIDLLKNGIQLILVDPIEGKRIRVAYGSLEELRKEWNIVNKYMDLEDYMRYVRIWFGVWLNIIRIKRKVFYIYYIFVICIFYYIGMHMICGMGMQNIWYDMIYMVLYVIYDMNI